MDQIPVPTIEQERLTWDEICRRYASEWVTLVDIDWVDESCFDFRSALLMGHAARRSSAMDQVEHALLQFEEVGIFFTGPLRGPIPRFIVE